MELTGNAVFRAALSKPKRRDGLEMLLMHHQCTLLGSLMLNTPAESSRALARALVSVFEHSDKAETIVDQCLRLEQESRKGGARETESMMAPPANYDLPQLEPLRPIPEAGPEPPLPDKVNISRSAEDYKLFMKAKFERENWENRAKRREQILEDHKRRCLCVGGILPCPFPLLPTLEPCNETCVAGAVAVHVGLLFASDYRTNVLGTIIRDLCANPRNMEIRMENPPMEAFQHLKLISSMVMNAIIRSKDQAPPILRNICAKLVEISGTTPGTPRALQIVGEFLITNFFCPAIVAPVAYGIMQLPPSGAAQANLFMVSRAVQLMFLEQWPMPQYMQGIKRLEQEVKPLTQEFLREFAVMQPASSKKAIRSIPREPNERDEALRHISRVARIFWNATRRAMQANRAPNMFRWLEGHGKTVEYLCAATETPGNTDSIMSLLVGDDPDPPSEPGSAGSTLSLPQGGTESARTSAGYGTDESDGARPPNDAPLRTMQRTETSSAPRRVPTASDLAGFRGLKGKVFTAPAGGTGTTTTGKEGVRPAPINTSATAPANGSAPSTPSSAPSTPAGSASPAPGTPTAEPQVKRTVLPGPIVLTRTSGNERAAPPSRSTTPNTPVTVPAPSTPTPATTPAATATPAPATTTTTTTTPAAKPAAAAEEEFPPPPDEEEFPPAPIFDDEPAPPIKRAATVNKKPPKPAPGASPAKETPAPAAKETPSTPTSNAKAAPAADPEAPPIVRRSTAGAKTGAKATPAATTTTSTPSTPTAAKTTPAAKPAAESAPVAKPAATAASTEPEKQPQQGQLLNQVGPRPSVGIKPRPSVGKRPPATTPAPEPTPEPAPIPTRAAPAPVKVTPVPPPAPMPNTDPMPPPPEETPVPEVKPRPSISRPKPPRNATVGAAFRMQQQQAAAAAAAQNAQNASSSTSENNPSLPPRPAPAIMARRPTIKKDRDSKRTSMYNRPIAEPSARPAGKPTRGFLAQAEVSDQPVPTYGQVADVVLVADKGGEVYRPELSSTYVPPPPSLDDIFGSASMKSSSPMAAAAATDSYEAPKKTTTPATTTPAATAKATPAATPATATTPAKATLPGPIVLTPSAKQEPAAAPVKAIPKALDSTGKRSTVGPTSAAGIARTASDPNVPRRPPRTTSPGSYNGIVPGGSPSGAAPAAPGAAYTTAATTGGMTRTASDPTIARSAASSSPTGKAPPLPTTLPPTNNTTTTTTTTSPSKAPPLPTQPSPTPASEPANKFAPAPRAAMKVGAVGKSSPLASQPAGSRASMPPPASAPMEASTPAAKAPATATTKAAPATTVTAKTAATAKPAARSASASEIPVGASANSSSPSPPVAAPIKRSPTVSAGAPIVRSATVSGGRPTAAPATTTGAGAAATGTTAPGASGTPPAPIARRPATLYTAAKK